MKKLTLALAGISLFGTFLSAEEMKPAQPPKTQASQPAKTESPKPAKAQPAKKAAKSAKKSGKMEAKAVYKCEHCNITSDKPGKCSMCGMEMKKI